MAILDQIFQMAFYFSAYSVTLLIGYIHGWLFGLLFLIRGQTNQHLPSKLLGLLMILLAQSLMLYMLGFGGIEIFWNELTFFPTSVAFLIGPVMWFYIRSLLDAQFRFRPSDGWHFIPFVIEFSYHLTVFLQGEAYARWHDEHIYIGANIYLIRDTLVLVSQGVYILMSLGLYRQFVRWAQAEYADAGQVERKWLGRFMSAMLVRWVVLVAVGLADLILDLNFEQDWWDNVFTCVVIYYLGLSAWGYVPLKQSHFVADHQEFDRPQVVQNLDIVASEQSDQNSIHTNQYSMLQNLMSSQRPWLDPELSLTSLARQADLHPKSLSALISQSGQNFNQFVNSYRVEEVIKLAQNKDFRHLSIVGLAFEAGFNSKSTFNRTFKELKGQTPTDYLRGLRLE